MNNKGYDDSPSALFKYITFLVRALPVRSVPTFIELLVGAMLTQTGFVTDAWLAINPLRTWTAYYKWLQEGKWSWVALGVQLARMVVKYFPQARVGFLFLTTPLSTGVQEKRQGLPFTISIATRPTDLSMRLANAG
jgi:hypothetical protein